MPHYDECGVYAIENTINGRVYVGGSRDIGRRWSWHLFKLRHNEHPSKEFQDDWNHYGEDAFRLRVLALTKLEDIIVQEQIFIDKLNAWPGGYNIKPTSTGFGYKHSEETKDRMRLAAYEVGDRPEERKRRSEQAKSQWKKGNIGRKNY